MITAPSVPIGESLALFNALQAHGVECELLVFPDEGHAIVKPQNLVVFYEQILRFLGQHLMTDSGTTRASQPAC